MPKRFALALFLIIVAWGGSGVGRQATTQPAPHRRTSTPYTGDLSVFDSPGRGQRLQINRVMDALQITAGKNVADIGAGSGWFTMIAARRVGRSGTVYAVDINPESKIYIDKRAQKEGLTNIKTVVSTPDDPHLPPNSTDSVLILKAYHEIANPVALMQNLIGALRPDARIGIIDRNGNGANHGVARAVVIKEVQEAGYRLVSKDDFVKDDGMDYFLVFVAKRM